MSLTLDYIALILAAVVAVVVIVMLNNANPAESLLSLPSIANDVHLTTYVNTPIWVIFNGTPSSINDTLNFVVRTQPKNGTSNVAFNKERKYQCTYIANRNINSIKT